MQLFKQLGIFGILCTLSLVGCGTRKEEDLETRRQMESGSSNSSGNLVLAGDGKNADAIATSSSCEVELKRSSEFDPNDAENPVIVYFRGQVASSCVTGGKRPEVLIHTSSKISVPGATCSPVEGEFNLNCQGDIVSAMADGSLSISFKGVSDTDSLNLLRIKVLYPE